MIHIRTFTSSVAGVTAALLCVLWPALASAQLKGAIVQAATSVGKPVLDPNNDGFVSETTAGFALDDLLESEIPYLAVPQMMREPLADLRTGANGGATDLVDTADGHRALFVYYDIGPDGLRDTADDRLLFRMRVGRNPSGAFGYSVLIDSDRKFGFGVDPNAVPGNPGFEVEIILGTGGSANGVSIYDVDGRTSGVLKRRWSQADHSQRSLALTTNSGDNDFFLDFFILFSELTNHFGITSSTKLRFVMATSSSPATALGGSASDIGGVDDDQFPRQDDAFETIVDFFPEIEVGDLDEDGGFYNYPPAANILAAPPAVTSSTVAEFHFGSDKPDVTFECALDGSAFVPCPQTHTITGLENGTYTLQVLARDPQGRLTPVPATHTWTVDTVPPEAIFIVTPAQLSSSSSALFEFDANEEPVTFECSLNGAEFGLCETPLVLTGLDDGGHTLRVRATDEAGNMQVQPTSYAWTIDTRPPVASFTDTPPLLSGDPDAVFTFTADESPVTFQCSLDGAPFSACESPLALVALADGPHTLEVRAIDQAGNVQPQPASYTWTIDTTGPVVELTQHPIELSGSDEATFEFVADEEATFECSLNGADFAACEAPLVLTDLADGEQTLTIRATDEAGNLSEDVVFTWTVDTTAPVVTIDSGPAALTNAPVATFVFSADESPVTFECRIKGGDFAACAAPLVLSGLVDGPHTFEVRAIDPAGNVSEVAQHLFVVDTVAPEALFTATPQALSSSSSALFEFDANESPVTFQCSLNGAALAACDTPLLLEGLEDGEHTIRVRATDLAGNVQPQPTAYSWAIDTRPPVVSLLSAPPALSADPDATFAFHADESPVSFECSVDGAPFAPCESPEQLLALVDGEHLFVVRATDAAGNLSDEVSFTWIVDTSAPAVSIITGPPALTNAADAAFEFLADEAHVTFECRIDGGPWTVCESPLLLSGVEDGEHTLSLRATDGAGNVSSEPVSWTWTVDASAPRTTFTETPLPSTLATTATFEFEADESPVTFECRLDGGAWETCESGVALAELSAGERVFEVRATDAAGNVESEPARYMWTIEKEPAVEPPAPEQPARGMFVGGGFGCSTSGPSVGWLMALMLLAPALRRRRALPGLLAALAVVTAPFAARATPLAGFDLGQFELNPGAEGSLVVGAGQVLPRGAWRASFASGYARNPLMYQVEGELAGALVGNRVSTSLAAAYGLTQRLEVGAILPGVAWQGGADLLGYGVTSPAVAGIGTPMVQGRFALLSRALGHPLDLAAQLGVRVPLGNRSAMAGDAGFGAVARLGASVPVGRHLVAGAEVGALLRREASVGTGEAALSELIGSHAHVAMTVSTVGRGLRGEATFLGAVPLTSAPSAGELLLGGRLPLARGLEAFALAGPGFGGMPGTPAFRAVAGLALAPRRPAPPAAAAPQPEPDPEPAPCTVAAECPDLDFDGDGIPNRADACPEEPGVPARNGCPIRDRDGDGIEDDEDACPDVAGVAAQNGCPEEPKLAAVTPVKIEVREKVYFDIGRATLQARSHPVLDEVASILLERSELLIRIEGHTDATGSAALNRRLSQQRAESVRGYLVGKGVKADRLKAEGFGPDRPADENDTEEGRENNRRVEFVIVGD